MTFAHGEVTKEIIVGIVNDNVVESSETLTVTLSNPQGGATLGTSVSATITINDEDVTPSNDTDDDGMADAWETQWFGSLAVAGPGTDFDNDGVWDLDEFGSSLNPAEPPIADGLIGFTALQLVGEGVFASQPGAAQEVVMRTRRPSTSRMVLLKNNAATSRRLTVWGNGGKRFFGLKYFSGGVDVTKAVMDGTFTSELLSPGGAQPLIVRVSVSSKARKRSFHRMNMDLRGVGAPRIDDRVSFLVIKR